MVRPESNVAGSITPGNSVVLKCKLPGVTGRDRIYIREDSESNIVAIYVISLGYFNHRALSSLEKLNTEY